MKSDKFIFKGTSGRFGKFRIAQVGGQAVISVRPVARINNGKSTSAFTCASRYATQVLQDSEMRRIYSLGINKKYTSAYLVALADYLNPPNIDEVDITQYEGHVADKIFVKASDNFLIKDVTVQVEQHGHVLIEAGIALRDNLNPGMYVYTCQSENKHLLLSNVLVHARDFAGNIAICCLSINGLPK